MSKRENKSFGIKGSISKRITFYMIGFSVLIIGVIAFLTKFYLPEYYTQHQLKVIESYKLQIESVYQEDDTREAAGYMDELQQSIGGELYVQTEAGQFQGYGRGKNAKYQRNNTQRFIPEGDITEYTYENKQGQNVYAMGIKVDDEYLVYEVSIHQLDDAVGVVLGFFTPLLLIVLVLAMIVALVMSRNISKPIKALNGLAKSMKSKKVSAVMVTDGNDEIAELNHSLNELYEELLSSIYHLESELKKERNGEMLKKRFLAQATHELKTPISIIRGFSEIVYDGIYKDEDERDRYIKNIYDETESMSHLILDVLDYTKMETGNYNLELEEVRGADYYEKIAERYVDFIENKGLQGIKFVEVNEEFSVTIDKNRIEQIIKNLIGNAIEHGDTYVSLKIEHSGDQLRIEVRNDGPSIDEEDLPYVFDSFYKKKGKQTGTGLGLAIVKEIVLLHKGDYRVENTEDGVRFIIYI